MDQRLSVLTLGTNDLAAMRSFYSYKLGWQTVAENKDIVFYKMNGFLFSLFDRNRLATGAGVPAQGAGFRALVLSYNVHARQEVDELLDQLTAKGVKILTAPQDTPFGGYFFYFADIEDNVLEVAYNPYVLLDAAGNVLTHQSIAHLSED
jgi:uncharacterized protein